MKGLSTGLKIGLLVAAAMTVGYITFMQVSEQASGNNGFPLTAGFKDASGLAAKSRVVIAGLPVGEITGRKLIGRMAEVTVKVRGDSEIWSNAAILKKQSSLLGEYYLEIDPGTPETVLPDGSVVKNTKLKKGDSISNVVEAASTDELIRRVNETVPQFNKTLAEIEALAADIRKQVNGPIANMAGNLDKEISRDTELVHSILARADAALSTIDSIARDVKGVTGPSQESVNQIIKNVEQVSADLKDLVAVTKSEVSLTGQSVREKLDKIDGTIASLDGTLKNTESISKKLDDDQGTLGKLVNDPRIAENVDSITTDVASFVKTSFGMQTYVGIRSEYNFESSLVKTYFSIELRPRPDKYYLVEIVDDPRGAAKEELLFVPGDPGSFQRTTVISTPLRFTLQFAKIFGAFTARIGIKESTGGVGFDLDLLDGNLRLSADAFDASYDELPRLKVWAALRFFQYLYVYGGIDDALNDHNEIPVAGNTITGQEATYHYGRDMFGGVMLRFNDLDLAAMLFIGGSALASAGN